MPDEKPKRRGNSKTRHGNGGSGQWGGPAKGAATDRGMRGVFAKGNQEATALRRLDRAERRASMIQIYEDVADDPKASRLERMTAADKWLDRVDGKPIARNVNLDVDDLAQLNDAALDAERAGLERALREASAGTAPPADPLRPDGVVH